MKYFFLYAIPVRQSDPVDITGRKRKKEILEAFHALQEQMSGLQFQKHTDLIPVWIPGESLAAPTS